jgi:hypothetical protein
LGNLGSSLHLRGNLLCVPTAPAVWCLWSQTARSASRNVLSGQVEHAHGDWLIRSARQSEICQGDTFTLHIYYTTRVTFAVSFYADARWYFNVSPRTPSPT